MSSPDVDVTGRSSRWRRLALNGMTLCVVAGAALGAGLRAASADARPVELAAGVPTELSPVQLARYVAESGRTLYWLGPLSGRKLEVTEAGSRGTFIRYVPAGADVARAGGLFTTVATYRVDGAYRTALRSSRGADAVSQRLGSGGVVVWRRSKPTNVYVAYPGSDVLVEIYDPDRLVSQRLARGDRIRPVS